MVNVSFAPLMRSTKCRYPVPESGQWLRPGRIRNAEPTKPFTALRRPEFKSACCILSPEAGDRRHAHVCSLPRCENDPHCPEGLVRND